MFCQNCGTELKDDAVFCTNCEMRNENRQSSQAPKQVSMGVVVGIVAGSLTIIAALFAFFIIFALDQFNHGFGTPNQPEREPTLSTPQHSSGIMATPAPVPPTPLPLPTPDLFTPIPGPEQIPQPATVVIDNELEGSWLFESGDWIWFFGQSDYVMFLEYFNYDEPIFGVYASEPDEWALCFFTDERYLIVEAEDGYYFAFTWIVDEDNLILIDNDGDMLYLIRYTE